MSGGESKLVVKTADLKISENQQSNRCNTVICCQLVRFWYFSHTLGL